MRFGWLVILGLFGGVSWAEPVGQSAYIVTPVQCPIGGCKVRNGALSSGDIQKFDDKVFNLTPAPTGPRFSVGVDGKQRYFGDEPDYHSAQHKRWLAECEQHLKNRSYPKFKKCYFEKKQAELSQVSAGR